MSAVLPLAPAMIAATCVPWPYRSTPLPPVKSFVTTTRPLSALCVKSIPESMTATLGRSPEICSGRGDPDYREQGREVVRMQLR